MNEAIQIISAAEAADCELGSNLKGVLPKSLFAEER
jgi:hypothetical protein